MNRPISCTHRLARPALFSAVVLLMSCGPQAEDPTPVDPVTQASVAGPLAQRLNTVFAEQYAAVEGLDYAALKAKHSHNYLNKLSFSVSSAKHYQGFLSAFSLSNKAVQTLDRRGFVVVDSPSSSGRGPADIYYRIFAKNLPVFISADSILHAWHRTFDKILEVTEQSDLSKELGELLSKTMAAIDAEDQAGRDALFYLAVARSLLDGSAPPAAVQAEVNRYLALVQGRKLSLVSFMGEETTIDFSQFIPRGHYTHSETLKKYFLAMMWLGRTDLVLHDPDPLAKPRPREEAAARALAGAMERSGAKVHFHKMDAFYAAFVGRTNALTPLALLDLCSQAGLPRCQGSASAMASVYAQQPPPDYSSRVFASDTPPVAMRFFPQRFAYGAWVTSRTTTPRLKPAVPGGRAMAMPEDVAFALGSDRALDYFAAEMKRPLRQNLPATLEAARRTMVQVKPTDLEQTVFNNWLEALSALSQPGLDSALPQVMRSDVWHDRKLEAVLASWAELRHDTILIVEQSTGGPGCQYPKGYVEPVPGLYASLDRAAALLAQVFAGGGYSTKYVGECMTHWRTTLSRLKALAEKELKSQAMDADDLAFLNNTADLHGNAYLGERMFDGWYPQLFWHSGWRPTGLTDNNSKYFSEHPSGISEPLVADVHTDADTGRALEVATGHPGLMVVAIDNGGDISLYGGPVSDYYSFAVPLSERMTDDQWQARVNAKTVPPKPAFTQAYWVR